MSTTPTPFDLPAALKAAKPGDAITVPPGEYGPVTLSRAKGLTLKGEGVTLASLTLSACEEVALEGFSVRLRPTATTVSSTSAVRVVQSRGITLKGVTARCGLAVAGLPQDTDPNISRASVGDSIIGLPIGRALTIDGCTGITVEGGDFGESHKGIVLNNSSAIRLLRNDIHDTRTGQISGAGVSDVVIEANRLLNSRPWKFGAKGDHGDFIHLWTEPKYQAGPSTYIVIRDNLIDQADGFPILGIYLDDNEKGLGFAGALIEGNVILNGNSQAIRLERTSGVVRNNVAIQTSGVPDDAPSIRLWDGSTVSLSGNQVADVHSDLKAAGALSANAIRAPGVDLARAEQERRAWAAQFRPQPAPPASQVVSSFTIDGVTFDIVRRAAA